MWLYGIATSSYERPPPTANSVFDFHSNLANYRSNNCCMSVIALIHYVFFETKSKVKFLMATVIINIHFLMYVFQ
jgi:hypothetical protein